MKLLSRNEEIVLVAVWRLRGNAYGVTIKDLVSAMTGYPWKFGAVYVTLDMLAGKGYVAKYESEPIAERGGRRKVLYDVTEAGKSALKLIREIHATLWDGLSNAVFDEA